MSGASRHRPRWPTNLWWRDGVSAPALSWVGSLWKAAKASDSPGKCCLGTCGPQEVPQPGPRPREIRVWPRVPENPGPLERVSLSRSGICFLSPEATGHPHCPAPRPAPGSTSGASLPGDGYYLAVGGAAAQHNSSYILAVLQDRRFRCQLIDSSEALGLISIQGPAR